MLLPYQWKQVNSNTIFTQFLLSSSEIPGEFCSSWNQCVSSVNSVVHKQLQGLQPQELWLGHPNKFRLLRAVGASRDDSQLLSHCSQL